MMASQKSKQWKVFLHYLDKKSIILPKPKLISTYLNVN